MKEPLMIRGIGTDIVSIDRIAMAIQRHGDRFLNKIFTLREQQYALSHTQSQVTFAGRFAAKEAIAKALGTGLSGAVCWKDIEVINNAQGKPTVQLSLSLQERFSSPTILISISHEKLYAVATAIWTE